MAGFAGLLLAVGLPIGILAAQDEAPDSRYVSNALEMSFRVTDPTKETSAPAPSTAPNTDVEILVNGRVEKAGTATIQMRGEQQVTTLVVDENKLQQRLEAEGRGAIITIPVHNGSDVVIGELNGRMVKNMESRQAVVEIRTEKAAYSLPAQQINIDAISSQLGAQVDQKDIKVSIEIATPQDENVKIIENTAHERGLTLVVPPLEFKVTAQYGDRTVEVTKFNAYVERTVAIPEGIDPNRITTGVVVDPDGTVRHVPTKVVKLDGKYYAVINSLTNSAYTVVWHPVEFSDVTRHWAKDAVNNMGSRMVIEGIGDGLFSPDRDITRAEFAAIMARGLGLRLENGTAYKDVKTSDWYASAIHTAHSYGLISGFEDGTFRPNENITREQAMLVVSKAMRLANLPGAGSEPDDILRVFSDAGHVSNWASSGVADSVNAGIITGRGSEALAPKAFITRAEVAMTMQRLLQKADLIND